MAKFFRHSNGIGWLKITWLELAKYSGNMMPICDECLKDLIGFSNVVLIPILNEAYCPECGKKVLERTKSYPEDKPIEERREKFWLNYFGIKEVK
jgi:predicted amidophosphoribosyltransferase